MSRSISSRLDTPAPDLLLSSIGKLVFQVFTLERASPDDGYDDDVIHYGQMFRLVLNSLLDFPVYLHSEHVTPMAASKYTRRQEVRTGVIITHVFYSVTRFLHGVVQRF